MNATAATPPTQRFPLVVYGSSALGNLYRAVTDAETLAIVRAWLATGGQPAVIDSAGKYGAGLALERLGRRLRELGATPDDVRIGVKLGWKRAPLLGPEPTFEPGVWIGLEHDAMQSVNAQGMHDCYEESLALLGDPFRPAMISVHDPDEHLAAATGPEDRERRRSDLADAYRALAEIRDRNPGMTLGVGAKDWRVAAEIDAMAKLDWVMIANCLTIYTHEPAALAFVADLARRGVPVVNSGVFNAGFLVGGNYFDYRSPSPTTDSGLFRWRDQFLALCRRRSVTPSHACIRFGLSPPGVVSVALNTTDPQRVPLNHRFAADPLPCSFWDEAREVGLIAADYPFLHRC